MKPHVTRALMALILAAGMLQAETWNKPVYELTGNTITVSGNVSYPMVLDDEYNDVSAAASGAVTVNGSGTISAPGDWDSFGSLSFENASTIVLDSGVSFVHFYLEGFSESATLKGTYKGCDIWFDGQLDLTSAKLQASDERACQLELSAGKTCKVSNLVVSSSSTSIMVYENNDPTIDGPVIQGNVTLNGTLPTFSGSQLTSEGCGIVFLCSTEGYYSSDYSTLEITGSLTISGNTPIEFYNSGVAKRLPSSTTDVIVCGSVNEAQLGYLKPYAGYDDGMDGALEAYDGHFTAQAGSDGKVHIKLASGAGPEPGPTPPGPVPGPTPGTGTIWNSPVYELTDNTITVSGNVAYPTVTGYNYNDVRVTASGAVTITGSGTVSAPDAYDSCGSLYFEDATSVLLDSGVTFRNFVIETQCETATLKGTYQACDIWFSGTVNLSQATLTPYGGNNCFVEFSPGATCIAENLVVSAATTELAVYGNYKDEPMANPVLQGNLTISGTIPNVDSKGHVTEWKGGGIEFSKYSPLQNYSTLVVTGSITVTQNTSVDFYNEGLFDSAPSPEDDIFICSSVNESQLGYLKPYLAHEQEDSDYLIVTAYNGHFTAQTESDGKVHIRLAEGAGPEPGPTPPGPAPVPEESIDVEPGQTVVLGESEETTPSAEKPVYLNGGTADATKLADSLLNNTIFTGKGGTVLTQDGQQATMTGADTLLYNMEGKDSSRGGDLAVGSAEGAGSNIQLKGDSYKVGAFTVQNGLATIGTGTTLDANTATVNAGGSITNFGNIIGNVELAAAGATMLNQGTVNNDVALRAGSTLVNNGAINGHTEIAGTAYGTGLFYTTQVLGGGALHIGNSPGYQHHNQLTLEDGGSLYFCVDGARQATLTDNGEGTHSYLAADNLTLNGVQDIEVEVGINFIAAVLLDRTATLKLAEFGAVDGTTTLDDQAFTYNVTDTTGLLETGVLTTDGASLSFTGTVGDKALAALAGSHGTQVANTMWASTSLLNDFADMAEERLAGKMEEGATIAWAGGLGSFQRETEHGAGYTYNGGGYALGVQHAFMRDFAAGVAFGQSFGHFEARDKSLKARQRGIMPALTARYRANSGKGAVSPVVTAHVAYGDMKYKADTYGLLPGHAEWTDRTLSAGITVGTEIKVGLETTVTPFVGLSYVAADQKDSVEDMGAINRRYHDGKMHNLSIPVGATLRSTMGAFTPEITLAYRADVDRKNPEVQCDCLGIKDTAAGAKPGRHSMYLNAGGTYAVSDNVGVFASYTLNVREHATNQSVNAGVQVSF